MAERRMFAKTIIDSDAFLDMPTSARLLYYDLSMRADDDGFINSPKKIIRMTGASDDDLKILIVKKFVIPFENGVVVIKHWLIHNYIRKDTYNETPYKEEKARLIVDENKSYKLICEDSMQSVDEPSTQVRLGKVSIDNIYGQDELDQTGTGNKETPVKEQWEEQFEKFYKKYPKKVKKQNVEKWFKKNKPSSELFSSIMSSLEQFRGSKDWLKDNGQYIPYPSTWLNQKRWEDEGTEVKEEKIEYKINALTEEEYLNKLKTEGKRYV